VNRRRLLGLLGVGLAGAAGCSFPVTQPVPLHRIARLSGTLRNPTTDALTAAFRQGLNDLGYVEGRNLVMEERYADGAQSLAEAAAEVVRLQVEAIFVPSVIDARIVRAATTSIPIVCGGAGDLVTTGLAASLARPGGNVTGLSTPNLISRQLELFQQVVPNLTRVAVVFATSSLPDQEPYQTAARDLGLDIQFVGIDTAEDLQGGMEAALGERAEALYIVGGAIFAANQDRIAELAIRYRLPTAWFQTEAVARGGLVAYGANRADLHRRAGGFVDRILKGATPADLPIEQPTVFDLGVNLKTAQALGLTVPASVLAQATEIVE
jgi:putative tryptophan/tyrosine transport system substrate-binding protein